MACQHLAEAEAKSGSALSKKRWSVRYIITVDTNFTLPRERQKNLLIITFDQLRGDWVDPKKPVIELPTLFGLMKSSWSARRCYTNSPQCVPARFSWITGLEPSQMGITKNADVNLPINAPSTIRDIQKKGWHTSIVGKTHWTSHNRGGDLRDKESHIKSLGFNQVLEVAGPRALQKVKCQLTDEWAAREIYDYHIEDLRKRYSKGFTRDAWIVKPTVLPNDLYPDIWIAEKGINEIKKLPSQEPWLMWISFVGPHEPFDTPYPWHGMHQEVELPDAKPSPDWISSLEEESELKKQWIKWKNKLDHKDVKSLRKDYADHLRLLDDQLSKIIIQLRSREDYKDTAIVITSDHGEMLGDAGMLYKSTFMEPAIKVPLIYREPGGLGREEVHNKPVSLTNSLKNVINCIQEGGETNKLREIIEKENKLVVSEFAQERLFIKGNKKICMDYDANIIWATDRRKEDKNCAVTEKFKERDWRELFLIAQKETKKRKKNGWIWKKLKSD